MISHDDHDQISHLARLAVLGMCVRGVAGAEFEAVDDAHVMRITVTRPVDGEQAAIDVEYFGAHPMAIGGFPL